MTPSTETEAMEKEAAKQATSQLAENNAAVSAVAKKTAAVVTARMKESTGKDILFVSRDDEPVAFDIALDPTTIISPSRDGSRKRLIFRVKPHLLERFKRHFFVISGRLVQAD